MPIYRLMVTGGIGSSFGTFPDDAAALARAQADADRYGTSCRVYLAGGRGVGTFIGRRTGRPELDPVTRRMTADRMAAGEFPEARASRKYS